MEEKIKVLLVQTGMEPQVVELENTLKALQQGVGGYIETWQPFGENVVLVCNEDGKLAGLPLNRPVYNQIGQMVDAIAGDFFICGQDEENFTSLTPAQLETYAAMFKVPQAFTYLEGKLIAMPIDPIPPAEVRPETQDTYRIYQINHVQPDDEAYNLRRDVSFAGLESLAKCGLAVDPANYKLVYTGKLEEWMTPEHLFHEFNMRIPTDFHGHLMSVSDVLVFVRNGKESAYFCDSVGFSNLGKFVTPESPAPAPRKSSKNKVPKKKGRDDAR